MPLQYRLLGILFLVGLNGLCYHPVGFARQTSLSSAALAGEKTIEAKTLLEQVRWLASPAMEGRASGTPGGDRAAAYIAEQFRQIGLEPLGDHGSYLQSFEIITGMRVGKRTRLALELMGGQKTYEAGVAFQPFGFSEPGSVRGEIVFAGYGITAPELHYDDYADLDVRGKIVLVMTHEPQETNPLGPFRQPEAFYYREARYKVINAREHGAQGVIVVTDPHHETPEQAKLLSPRGGGSASAGIAAVNAAAEVAEAILAPSGKRLVDLQRAIDQSVQPQSFVVPGVVAHLEVELIHEKGQATNVIGVLLGRDPRLKEEAILIGAHYDHLGRGGEGSLAPDQYGEIHPGADDNASGVAGVIALARAFAQARVPRSLVFVAFGAEELGLLGSSHYVNHPPWPLEKSYTMINLDAIGRLAHNRLYILGVDSTPVFRGLLQRAAEGSNLSLQFSGDGFGPSDHTPFYAKERPVLMFFTGPHEDYHRPSDTPDKINAEGLAVVVRLVYRTTTLLGQHPEPLTFVRAKAEPSPLRARGVGYGAYFGSIPDFSESPIPGVKLLGVRLESPAEKAGLQAGDIIIRFADVTIRNLNDLVFALRSKRPGDQVEVIYLRNGQRLQAQATLESRH